MFTVEKTKQDSSLSLSDLINILDISEQRNSNPKHSGKCKGLFFFTHTIEFLYDLPH